MMMDATEPDSLTIYKAKCAAQAAVIAEWEKTAHLTNRQSVTITKLQAEVEDLTEALKDIYKATTDLQVMSIVMANLPQPKTIPAALPQEGE
jgi:uncharacterized coiled-coil protein SlyX